MFLLPISCIAGEANCRKLALNLTLSFRFHSEFSYVILVPNNTLALRMMMILICFGKRYMENWKSDNGPHWLPQITSQDDEETCRESFPPSFPPSKWCWCLLIMNTKQRKMTKEVISLCNGHDILQIALFSRKRQENRPRWGQNSRGWPWLHAIVIRKYLLLKWWEYRSFCHQFSKTQ